MLFQIRREGPLAPGILYYGNSKHSRALRREGPPGPRNIVLRYSKHSRSLRREGPPGPRNIVLRYLRARGCSGVCSSVCATFY